VTKLFKEVVVDQLDKYFEKLDKAMDEATDTEDYLEKRAEIRNDVFGRFATT